MYYLLLIFVYKSKTNINNSNELFIAYIYLLKKPIYLRKKDFNTL